jgi:hypothetical protein
MNARWVAAALLSGCASVAPNPAPTEGRTSGGIAYDVRGSGPTVVLTAADSLTKGIRGATRVTVPNAGHLVNMWEPRLFADVVARFLEGKSVGR